MPAEIYGYSSMFLKIFIKNNFHATDNIEDNKDSIMAINLVTLIHELGHILRRLLIY